MTIHSNPLAGLDGIAAAVTALSHVDGEKGELIVGGMRIGDLADRTDFEGLAARLWAAGDGASGRRGGGEAPARVGTCRGLRTAAGDPAGDGGPADGRRLPRRGGGGRARRRARCRGDDGRCDAGACGGTRAPGGRQGAGRSRSAPRARGRHVENDARRGRGRGGGKRARRLSRHRRRPRHERLDLRRPRGGIDAGEPVHGGDGWLLRA